MSETDELIEARRLLRSLEYYVTDNAMSRRLRSYNDRHYPRRPTVPYPSLNPEGGSDA